MVIDLIPRRLYIQVSQQTAQQIIITASAHVHGVSATFSPPLLSASTQQGLLAPLQSFVKLLS